MSAFEVLDAIVTILVSGQRALTCEGLAALMAYKRFLARVDAIVTIEMTLLLIRGVIASVPISSIHLHPLAFLIAFEDLFALDIE